MEDSKMTDTAPADLSAEATSTDSLKKVKPVLKKHHDDGKEGRPKKELKWDEEIIEEHDQLRGTRMKVRECGNDLRVFTSDSDNIFLQLQKQIEEPNTPYTHYDSHSDGNESDGSMKRPKSPAEQEKVLSWDELHVRLKDVADNYPSSPSSQGGEDVKKHQEFVEARKHHVSRENRGWKAHIVMVGRLTSNLSRSSYFSTTKWKW
jgi:protein phosphatase inhibitor 2